MVRWRMRFKLIDFVARGEEAGTQLVEGVNGGIGEASENLSEEDIIALREAMLEAMREVFGIHSPAESMFPIGEAAGRRHPVQHAGTNVEKLRIWGLFHCGRHCSRGTSKHELTDRHYYAILAAAAAAARGASLQ